MLKEYKLITPTQDDINTIWNLWFHKQGEKPKTTICLFGGEEEKEIVDISEWKDSQKKNLVSAFHEYGDKDREIIEEKEKNFPNFLKMINDTYHTRISFNKNKGDWYDKDWNLEHVDKMCKEELERKCCSGDVVGIDRFIKICKEKTGRNEYSFATKVFSFMYQEKFPILDSITVSLLNWYVTNSKPSEYYGRQKWGNYQCYMEDYRKLLNVWELSKPNSEFSFKKADVFLWTYGILIQQYWKNQGVIGFESVQYKAPKEP